MNKQIIKILASLGIENKQLGCSTGSNWMGYGEVISTISPVDGSSLPDVTTANVDDYEMIIDSAENAFQIFKKIPAPKRGNLVRQFGDALRNQKENLGKLVSYEMVKSYQEGLGEVQ